MRFFIVCAAALTATVAARADLIGFETLSTGTHVTNQFPGVTFSSDAGHRVQVDSSFNFGTGLYACTATSAGVLNCDRSIFVQFSSPVTGVRFFAMGDDAAGTQAIARGFNGATLLGSVNVSVDGVFLSTHLVDLTALGAITRLEIVNVTDPGGLAFDEFQYVPSPSTAILAAPMLLCLARRRRAR